MTADTQGQRLTDAERETLRAAWSEWTLTAEHPRPRPLARIFDAVERILAARCPGEGPTDTDVASALNLALLRVGEGDLSMVAIDHIVRDLRNAGILAEHAPFDDGMATNSDVKSSVSVQRQTAEHAPTE